MPTLRDRSSSRSRAPAPSSSKKSKMSKSPSPTKKKATPKKSASKSPARSRGRPATSDKNKTPAARQASKSASRKTNSASRSRSRSRGRPPKETTSSAPSSSARSRSATRKTPREVVKTIEVADEDEEVTSTPKLRQRSVRNLTQEPPASRSRITPRTETYPTRSVSRQNRAQLTLKDNVVSKINAGFAYVAKIILCIWSLICCGANRLKDGIQWPFKKAIGVYKKQTKKNAKLFWTVVVVVVVTFAALFFCRECLVKHSRTAISFFENNIRLPIQRNLVKFGSNVAKIPGTVHTWSLNQWKHLNDAWNQGTVKIK